jgi:hypothetical protein
MNLFPWKVRALAVRVKWSRLRLKFKRQEMVGGKSFAP